MRSPPRLMMGIAEPIRNIAPLQRSSLMAARIKAPHMLSAFGDLTVLINPAFEATRFEPLAQAAVSRHYVAADPNLKQRRNWPLLIVATSRTDGLPAPRSPVPPESQRPFERASGAERSANIARSAGRAAIRPTRSRLIRPPIPATRPTP